MQLNKLKPKYAFTNNTVKINSEKIIRFLFFKKNPDINHPIKLINILNPIIIYIFKGGIENITQNITDTQKVKNNIF